MHALREMQLRFYDGILAGGEAEDLLLNCIVESGEAGRRGIAAYRRSIVGTLIGALLATYPVLARIVGEPFFRGVARAYIQTHPSSSGDLNEYGQDFDEFVAGWPEGRDLGYLRDVARLEWRVQEAYYAPDLSIDLSALASCPPENYGLLRFQLGLMRMDSVWPLADIWRVNAEGYAGDMTVDFSSDARLAILRHEGLVHVESLTGGEAAFLDALARAECLEEATQSAQRIETAFDLGACLARFIGNGAIVRAWLPTQNEKRLS